MREILPEESKRIVYDTLVYFADFCKSHGLRYFLAYGTLLGAVRHGGFIPWDDDIDVWMPREDYDKLLACADEISAHSAYELSAIEINPLFRLPFGKLSRKDTILIEKLSSSPNPFLNEYVMRLSIDVFPLDSFVASDDDMTARAEYEDFWKRETRIVRRYHPGRAPGLRGALKAVWYKVICLLYGDMAPRMRAWARMLADRPCQGTAPYVTCVGTPCFYRKEWFQESVKLKFESGEFNAPFDYDSVLRRVYGDYMTPPPPKERYAPHIAKAYYIDLPPHGDES